jgi:hypothetical protein
VNALADELASQGHRQDVYLPLTAATDPIAEGFVRVAAGDGTVVDPFNQELPFELWMREGPIVHENGARRTDFYFGEPSYWQGRRGLYADAKTGADYPDKEARLVVGAALATAAISKVAAIRKLGKDTDLASLTADKVKRGEQTLERADMPGLIQYNDPHFALSHAFHQHNENLRDVPALGVIHCAKPGVQPTLSRDLVENVLRPLGGRFEAPSTRTGTST